MANCLGDGAWGVGLRDISQCDDEEPTPQQALRHVWATPLGGLLFVGGLVMVALPGPSLPLLFGGLVLLSREYEWARRLLGVLRRRVPARWTKAPRWGTRARRTLPNASAAP